MRVWVGNPICILGIAAAYRAQQQLDLNHTSLVEVNVCGHIPIISAQYLIYYIAIAAEVTIAAPIFIRFF